MSDEVEVVSDDPAVWAHGMLPHIAAPVNPEA